MNDVSLDTNNGNFERRRPYGRAAPLTQYQCAAITTVGFTQPILTAFALAISPANTSAESTCAGLCAQ